MSKKHVRKRINKFFWKKSLKELKIDKSEEKRILQMIKSSDIENGNLGIQIIKELHKDKTRESLGLDQIQAFDFMIDFIENGVAEAFVLKGYAGTGKTYLIRMLATYIESTDPEARTVMTAPTNKAVKVLREGDDDNESVEYQTVHKLLSLREYITKEGEQIFKPDGNKKSDIRSYKLLIVDEVSMLDDKLCEMLLEHSDKVKIIFMGDPAQIPPINRVDSIPFRDDHNHKFILAELNEIHRQKGDNPIVAKSFIIRDRLFVKQPIPVLSTELNDKGQGIIYFDSDKEKAKLIPILQELFCSDEFAKDANHAKVIAWTNKVVNYMNERIRNLLYGENPAQFVIGEKLIANKPIFKMGYNKWGKNWDVQFTTSDELVVVNIEEKKLYNAEAEFEGEFNYWKLYVENDAYYTPKPVYVIKPEDANGHAELAKKARSKALESKDVKDWVNYFNILKWSANVGYNYAITAHKSQGSTYKNVVIIEDNIDKNHKTVERNRIKYTSYTRASNKLFILRKNYG